MTNDDSDTAKLTRSRETTVSHAQWSTSQSTIAIDDAQGEPELFSNGKVDQLTNHGAGAHTLAEGPALSLDLDEGLRHLDQSVLYQQKSPHNGSLPKSSLISPNALHLQIDEPQLGPHLPFPPSSPPSSPDEPALPTSPTNPRVRFRSRVRITSGLHHHRHTTTQSGDPTSVASSASGSPSSSISAPLRSQADDDSNPWGPLGRRVSYMAWQKRLLLPTPAPQAVGSRPAHQRRSFAPGTRDAGERTPLNSSFVRRYVGDEPDSFDESLEDNRLDLVFGKWPGRLFNHHWWWWQLEPVVCCHCIEESDSED